MRPISKRPRRIILQQLPFNHHHHLTPIIIETTRQIHLDRLHKNSTKMTWLKSHMTRRGASPTKINNRHQVQDLFHPISIANSICNFKTSFDSNLNHPIEQSNDANCEQKQNDRLSSNSDENKHDNNLISTPQPQLLDNQVIIMNKTTATTSMNAQATTHAKKCPKNVLINHQLPRRRSISLNSCKQIMSSSILLFIAISLKLQVSSVTSASSSSMHQYFEVQPEPQYSILNGQDVRLRCLIRNRQGECHWLHNGKIRMPIKNKYSYSRQPEDGDCSLLIRNSSVQLDDGQWQCQVSANELDQPEIESRQVNLIVLIAPDRPQIKDLPMDKPRLVVEENEPKFVTCEMRGGNPAPRIEWLLDGKNITKEATQILLNVGQNNNNAQQQASNQNIIQHRISQSKLKLIDIKRQMNAKTLACVGVHPTQNQSTLVELEVQYLPSVSVSQREHSIVEGSPLRIECQVDANPAPTLIKWQLVNDGQQQAARDQSQATGLAMVKTGATSIIGPILEFQHIGRESNQDIWECFAQNSRGISQPISVKLNVLFAPAVLNSSQSSSVPVGGDAQLSCLFEGNPQPDIKWFYTDPLSKSANTVQLDNDKKSLLSIKNVTYRNEGDYYCEAKNYINGQTYTSRSSNILLDIFGDPQFIVKSPLNAKAIQGSKSDISLTFCSDPPPRQVYWQFGSIRIDVRLNNSSSSSSSPAANGVNQVAPSGGGLANNKLQHQVASVLQRFQAQPLHPIQRRDSHFSKVKTCFEATLSLLDPEVTDQRDYTLNVMNEKGFQSGSIRLRVSSPLSPVLMISSAFGTICLLFVCSLLIMFVFKKKEQLFASRRRATTTATTTTTSGNQQQRNGHSNNHSQHSISNNNKTTNGQSSGARLANEKNRDMQTIANGNNHHHHHHTSSNGTIISNDDANSTLALSIGQQQQMGTVNGLGNGLANGASNPIITLDTETQKALHMMSMASSDTSCNDQKQLLAHSDRNSSTTSSNGSRSSDDGRVGINSSQGHQNLALHHHDNRSERSTANSTPTPMNHISVDEELNDLNGSTYRAAESVTQGARLTVSPLSLQAAGATGTGNGLIYANLDFVSASSPSVTDMHNNNNSNQHHHKMMMQAGDQQQHHPITTLRRQQTSILSSSASHNSPTDSNQLLTPVNIVEDQHCRVQYGAENATMNNGLDSTSQHHHHHHNNNLGDNNNTADTIRPSVGATIAMMNSLAAAAAAAGATSPVSGAGVLNGAINQQLANNRANSSNNGQQVRRPGPPKPPKPSIQQRSRFYQQQVVANGGDPGGLVMIGQQQQQMDQNTDQARNDLAIEYSRLAFPARAEL